MTERAVNTNVSLTELTNMAGRIITEHANAGQTPPVEPELGALALDRIIACRREIDARRIASGEGPLFAA